MGKEIKERPILFSGPLVRALIEGRKTVTRRPMKPIPAELGDGSWGWPCNAVKSCLRIDGKHADTPGTFAALCTYGRPGDRLWVRETHGFGFYEHERHYNDANGGSCSVIEWRSMQDWPEDASAAGGVWYYADGDPPADKTVHGDGEGPYEYEGGWDKHPSIHMPRWASRITLEVTSVAVERVQDITTEGVRAEGIDDGFTNPKMGKRHDAGMRMAFETAWDGIYAERHGLPWHANPWVWAVGFKRIDGEAQP